MVSSAVTPIRSHFAAEENPYAGGDLANAQRLGAVLWALVLVLMVGLLPLSPPDEAIGEPGWAVAVFAVGSVCALAVGLHSQRIFESWNRLLLAAYLGVVAIAVVGLLAGGAGTPYSNLLFMPVIFVAGIHPTRKTALFLLFVLLALGCGFLESGWSAEEAGAAIVRFVTWSALAGLIGLLMSGVRAQRVAMAEDEARARDEARRDSLTGLPNRRAFDEAAVSETDQARSMDVPLSLVLVDIEGFKQVNDHFGHLEGDRCLQEVATTIGAQLRKPISASAGEAMSSPCCSPAPTPRAAGTSRQGWWSRCAEPASGPTASPS